MATDFLVQQVDGISRFLLQDGSGFLILQSSDVVSIQKSDITVQIPSTQDINTFIPSTQDKPIQLNDNDDIRVIV